MKRVSNLSFILVFVALLFAVPIVTLLGPREYVSYYEQRTLAVNPPITREGLLDGQYFTDVETALSDHIMGRDSLVKLNIWCDLTLGRPVVNDLVVSSDALLDFYGYYLTWDTAYLTDDAAEMGIQLQSLNEGIKAYGGYFCYLGLPLQSNYFASLYPDYMDNRLWHVEAIGEAFSNALQENDVPFIDMTAVYETLGAPASYYAQTDHHYTYQGAFVAYTTLMNRINADTDSALTVLTEDDLDFVTLANTYLGSSNRKLYGLWSGQDKLEIGLLKNPIAFTRTDNGVSVEASLYDLPESETEDVTYSVYMGGDMAETVIETNRPELPNVLIFGDSFTNPLETLVWASFNETRCLDLRYYTAESLRDYIAQYQPDVVICVRDETAYLTTDGNGAISP